MVLYKMVKMSLGEPVKIREYEILVETTVSFTFKQDSGQLLTLSKVKIGTEYFETPADAKVDYIRRMKESIKGFADMITHASQGLTEAQAYEIEEV